MMQMWYYESAIYTQKLGQKCHPEVGLKVPPRCWSRNVTLRHKGGARSWLARLARPSTPTPSRSHQKCKIFNFNHFLRYSSILRFKSYTSYSGYTSLQAMQRRELKNRFCRKIATRHVCEQHVTYWFMKCTVWELINLFNPSTIVWTLRQSF